MDPLTCMVAVIFFETRGELKDNPDAGLAVADVVLNRVEDPRWPNTVCGVVWQPEQFSWTHDGKSDNPSTYAKQSEDERKALHISESIAIKALEGETLGITSNHYHALYVNPSWNKRMVFDGIIGKHKFYTKK